MNVLGGVLTKCFIAKITSGISCGNEAPLLWASCCPRRGREAFEREKLDAYRLKLPLLHRHIVEVSELVMRTGSGGKRPHTTDGAIAYKLGWYKITVYHGVIRTGRDVDCV